MPPSCRSLLENQVIFEQSIDFVGFEDPATAVGPKIAAPGSLESYIARKHCSTDMGFLIPPTKSNCQD